MTDEMIRYYAQRASEYDRIYGLPAWQRDLAVLRRRVAGFFAGRHVFEVACGTGYWTQCAAEQAAGIVATDLNHEVLALARARSYGYVPVEFRRADAYAPSPGPRPAGDAGLAAFWLSHVDLGRMPEFVSAFHSHLVPGSPVLMFDERPTDSRGVPASRTDAAAGNRHEMRRLAKGEHFEIIKNFYDGPRLEALLGSTAGDFVYEPLEWFWVASYRLRPGPGPDPR